MKRTAIWFLLLTVICCVVSGVAFAGGDFKAKIQRKMNDSRNVQYNLDYLGSRSGSQQISQDEGFALPAAQSVAVAGAINLEANEVAKSELRRYQDKDASLLRADTYQAPVLSPYAIYKADYSAEIDEDVATVKGKVLFQVFHSGWTQIPLVSNRAGLIDVSVNRGTSFVTTQNGKYYLMCDKPGKYDLVYEFLVKAARERENGPGNFSFEVMPAPISQFEFTMAETGVDIFVDPSIKLELKKEAHRTVAWAIMPNTQQLTVRWTKALPKETITAVQLEPKVYVDTTTSASFGEGVIRCTTTFNYSILQSEISNMRIVFPKNVSILEVQGNDLRDWKSSTKDAKQYLDIYLNFGIKGNYSFSVVYEKKIGDGSQVAEIPEVTVKGVEREKGYFGIAAASNVELAVKKVENASAIDVKELPASIWGSTANPMLIAFKYLNHPYNIVVEVTKHEELPVLLAAIDSVQYTTLQTAEGKSVTKAVYQLRNNVKQFLHLWLPKGTTLWSAFVAGKPVKPAKDKSGSILIPLEKSQFSGEDLAQFPVEIVYLDKGAKMNFLGNLVLSLPKTDLPISSLSWSLYLPFDYAYLHFGGDVKEVEGALPGGRSRFGRVASMKEAASQLSVSNFRKGAEEKQSRGGRDVQMQGALPIKIDVPEQGRFYCFSKLLITENETPKLSVFFLYGVKQLLWLVGFLFKLAIFSLIVLFLLKIAKKIAKKVK